MLFESHRRIVLEYNRLGFTAEQNSFGKVNLISILSLQMKTTKFVIEKFKGSDILINVVQVTRRFKVGSQSVKELS